MYVYVLNDNVKLNLTSCTLFRLKSIIDK